MAGSEAPALRKPPATATPIRLPLPRQSPTLPFSATDPGMLSAAVKEEGKAASG